VASLQDLLVREATDLLNMEEQLVEGLGRLAAAATNEDLHSLLERHERETERHAERLARVLRSIGAAPRRETARAVHAADIEARAFLKRKVDADVRDAWIIGTAQRLEHLEIASYGTARAFAETLGYTYAAQLLQQTLEEEKAMDHQLTRLAERFVNPGSIR
jgi:ferritin-like metal-binding protein YciE